MRKLMMMSAAVATAALTAFADTETVGDYTWTYRINDDGTAEIVNEISDGDYSYFEVAVDPIPNSAVTIPSMLGGKPVTRIGTWAFHAGGYYEWANVTIPDSVTSIGSEAFFYCLGLKSLTIPNSVTNIGDWAFAGCVGLENVTIGNGVTSIGAGMFDFCRSLTNVTIGSSVTNIGGSAFHLSGLGSVTIPASVTCIEDYAFSECGQLTNVIFCGNAPTIATDDYGYACVFENVGYDCIAYVKRGSTGWGVEIPGTWNGIWIEYAQDKEPIANAPVFTIVDGVLIAVDLNGNTEVAIPDGVTSIGDAVFVFRSELTSVTIPSSVTNIGKWAFCMCSSLTNAPLPAHVGNIGQFAFCRTALSDVTIPATATSVGGGAFSGCGNLDAIAVAAGNPSYEFADGLLLTTDGSTLVSVPGGSTEVTVPDGVTRIDTGAFNGCVSLVGVVIPASVASIGDYAFEGCGGLLEMTFLGNAPSVGTDAFRDVNQDCTAFVGRDSTGWGVEIPGTWNGIGIAYAPGDEVVVEVGNGKSVAVPQAWIAEHQSLVEAAGGDVMAALTGTAANGRMSVVECYVLGLDPEDWANDFKIVSFPMGADGKPDLENIVFSPAKEEWNVNAQAVLKGAETVDGDWHEVDKESEEDRAKYRFYKVVVELP